MQYVCVLAAGQTITGAQAVQFVARFTETTTGNNMNSSFGIRIIAADGTTLRKSVLAVAREVAEFDAGTPGTLEARNNTATSVAGNYTTVEGDCLVVEIGAGGDPGGSSPHTYNIDLGDNAGTFLTANDTETTANDPWVQLADTLTIYRGQLSATQATFSRTLQSAEFVPPERFPILAMSRMIQ